MAESFTVRARGLFANTFVIQRDDATVGHLIFKGLSDAEFATGIIKSTIERRPNGEYEMFSGKDRILVARPPTSSLDTLEITCGDGVYQARISFLRNEAKAFSVGGGEMAKLKGNMTGRRYEVATDQTDTALPVAILLLYHTAAVRRRAFVA